MRSPRWRRNTWWWCSAAITSASKSAIGELAGTLGRPIEAATQDQQLGTGHAVLCGLSALPDDFRGVVVVTSGDIPLLDADTLADLVASA